jgi:acetyl-CoA C-acetyltransferase
VVVGAGQWSNRVDRGDSPVEPVDLVAGALRRAAQDAGSSRDVLAAADSVWIVQLLSWRYANPAALVAERVGANPRDTALSPMGGNEPHALVNRACRDIAAGERDLVLIGGAEAWRSRAADGGKRLGWTPQSDADVPARRTGDEVPMNHPAEIARQVLMPAQVYPLFDQALRHAAGRSVDEHLTHMAALWSRFSRVAAGNPHAWQQREIPADEIRTPSPANRWIWWPYTKLMNSNNAVEQGAGLIVTSVEKAEALGIPRDRWVFPLAGAEAHDHYAVSHRADLHSSPAIHLTGRKVLELAGVGIDDVAHVDLYSCFPSAVQIGAAELGLDIERDLTVTGGLSFAGGPWNNYVTHSVATMLDVLRDDPGSVGLVTANGGYLTKHSLVLYSTEPPADGFRWASVQDEVDALPRREVCEQLDSGQSGEIETWVVGYDREGRPERAIAAVTLDDGRRAWADSNHADTLAELVSGAEQIGRSVKLSAEGALQL